MVKTCARKQAVIKGQILDRDSVSGGERFQDSDGSDEACKCSSRRLTFGIVEESLSEQPVARCNERASLGETKASGQTREELLKA